MSNLNFRKEIINTRSAKGTMALGKKMAQCLIKQGLMDGASVLALWGDLGSGKTTFTQGLAKELGINDKITSPTFVLMKKFAIPNYKLQTTNYKLQTTNYKLFYHIDCYRLGKPEEILALGWREIIANPQNIVAVEWPEKIKKLLPRERVNLKFKFLNQTQRQIICV